MARLPCTAFVTGNRMKLQEVQAILANADVDLTSQDLDGKVINYISSTPLD